MREQNYKRSLFLFSFLLLLVKANAQSTDTVFPLITKGKKITDLIPKGWDTLTSVHSFDFNNDMLQDKVMILRSKKDTSMGDMMQVLLILQGTRKGYIVSGYSKGTVMCKECGGAFGDPFSDLAVDGKALTIDHYGGSSERWSFSSTFTYFAQTNKWMLTHSENGSTSPHNSCDSTGELGYTHTEIDHLTNEVRTRSLGKDCKEDATEYKQSPKPLIRLEEFDIYKDHN